MEDGVEAVVRQDTERRKRTKQQVTIPFVWEEKPGMPRKDWKIVRPSRPPPPPPVKFIVSVPFKWEEKPGTPLPSFAPSDDQSSESAPELEITRCLPPPPAYYPIWEYDHVEYYRQDSEDDNDVDERDWIRELENLSSTIQTAESSSFRSSAPSLLANRLMPKSTVSSAIPIENFPPQSSSSISSSDTSSYATGSMSSPIGNTFLEQLFPLHPPTNKSTFTGMTAGCSGQTNMPPGRGVFSFTTAQQIPKSVQHYNGGESNSRVTTRGQLTLGELIMLSRRRSYMRKAFPVDLTSNFGFVANPCNKEGLEEQKPLGCFGGANDRISKLLGGKRLLSLKLT